MLTRSLGLCLRLTLAAPLGLRAQVPTPNDVAVVAVHVTSEGRGIDAAIVRSGTGPAAVAALTNDDGIATLRLRAGEHRLVASKAGYGADSVTVTLRAGTDTTVTVALHAAGAAEKEGPAELSGVVITATRGQRRVTDEPTRVDVLDHEEVEEQTAMSPGNSVMLLSETGGVRVTTTSPALGGANVRILGLRGRYTQLLSDGLPLYGLTIDGLGLLQIPPIDLRQVELIKGAASALYGPSALGGMINFVSRRPPVLLPDRPRETRELYVNQTTRDGTDAALFDARALSERWGYTLLASGNRQSRQDLDGDGWADLPAFRRVVVRPRVFWTGNGGSDVLLTSGFTAEDRSGGTMAGATLAGEPFPETRDTRRADGGVAAHVRIGDGATLALRGSATGESRNSNYGPGDTNRERDRRSTLFGEAALTLQPTAAQELVVGAAAQRDSFDPRDVPSLAYTFTAPAIFAQHTWTPARWFGLTSSARLDAHNEYGTSLSPRVSLLLRPWSQGTLAGWTARVSAGAGTYAPTPFVEDLEEVGLRRLSPFLEPNAALRAERARSGSADVGGMVGPLELNVAVNASVIDHAVGVRPVGSGAASGDSAELVNATLPTRSTGAQVFARYHTGPYSLTGSYDYQHTTEQDVEQSAPTRRELPLTPRHGAGLTASWEAADDAGVAVEAFYTGSQALGDNPYRTTSKPYVLVGALARVRLGKSILYINGENLGNIRQTHFDPLLRPAPTLGGRWTTDVWAPLDGAVANLGVRVGF